MDILSVTGKVVETDFNHFYESMLTELLRDLGCDVSPLEDAEGMIWMYYEYSESYSTALAKAHGEIQVVLIPDTSYADGWRPRLLAPGAEPEPGERAEPLSNHPTIASWLQEVQVAFSADHVFIHWL